MFKKRRKILVGTVVIAFVGWVLGLLFDLPPAGYWVYVGVPLVVGSVLAVLADD